MALHSEARSGGHLPDRSTERPLEGSRDIEVDDIATAQALEVMVVTDETLVELVERPAVGGRHAVDAPGFFENREVAVSRALGDASGSRHDGRHGRRAVARREGRHQPPAPVGVALADRLQPPGHGRVELGVGRGHRAHRPMWVAPRM